MTRTSSKEKSTVFIVDDHPLVREWLGNLINQQPDLQTCGDASNAVEALDLITRLKPQLVVLDISLPGRSGIELIKDIKAAAPDVAVIVFSVHDDSFYAERALRAGAHAYVMKREVTKTILQAIRCVLEGKTYLSDKLSSVMTGNSLERRLPAKASAVSPLSDRELEVFQLLGCGRTNRQIAEELQVSFSTVQSFCARMKIKLGIDNSTELLRHAVRWNEGRMAQ